MGLPFVVIDFETASKADLKKVGAWRYAEDPSTRILCLAAMEENGEPWDWLISGLNAKRLADLVADVRVMFIAHNVAFEKAIWRHIMVPKYGFQDIVNQRWHDTMAVCAMRRLPLGLEHAAAKLRLHTPKDVEGRALVLKISRDYRKTGVLDLGADQLERVRSYCIQDVRAEMALHDRLGALPPGERKVWLLDQTANERGVALDLPFVASAQQVLDDALPSLVAEFAKLTATAENPAGLKHGQRDKVLDWLQDVQCVFLPDMKKKTVDALLGPEEDDDADQEEVEAGDPGLSFGALPPDAARALTLRSLMRSSSVTKLGRMAGCANRDDRARGLLQYHGAGTGRWSGRLFQPQNFPRGTNKVGSGLVVETIHTAAKLREPSYVNLALETPPFEAISSALRHCLVPSTGNVLACGDFAQIEARIVLALAGQRDKVDLFASGAPIYADMAQAIYGHPVTKAANLEEYTIGKNTVLGCGFQMAGPTFQRRYAEKHPLSFCERVIETYRTEWAPQVPKLWHGLETAALKVMEDGKPHESYGFRFAMSGDWLTVLLPSGRLLWYYDPRVEENKFGNDGITFVQGRGRKDLYGGKWTENVDQALARDIMVAAMLEAEKEFGSVTDPNVGIVLTNHDEILVETPRQDAAVALGQIMEETNNLPWVKALRIPVAVETWQGLEYRK